MNISKYLMGAASLILALSSCSDDGYWDEYNEKEVTYSFEQSTLNVETVKDANTFTINVVRSTKKGATILPITLSNVADVTFDGADPSNNITLSTNTLTFEDGQNEASIDVTINCLGGHEYVGQLSFPAEQVSVSGSSVCEMTFATEHNWVSLGTGLFIDQFFLGDGEYPVEILQAEGFNRWRVLQPYTAGMEADDGGLADWRTGTYPAYLEFWQVGEYLTWTPISLGVNYQAVSGQAIWSYPPSALGSSMRNCRWYQPGYAVLAPYYFIPKLNGGFDQTGSLGVVQIIFPELLGE
ncbi:MAG: hypothetical protein K2J65_05375 [Duncaniella sp.]|nr:hypothetical protein [Duncaniella sp.]